MRVSHGPSWWPRRPRFLPRRPASTRRGRTRRARAGRPPRSPPRARASGLLGGHPKRDMDCPAAARARLRPSLEPERPANIAWVDQVLVGAVRTAVVAEQCLPERHHLGGARRARDDRQAPDRGGVGDDAQAPRDGGDLPGDLDVAVAHATRRSLGRDEPDDHRGRPHVDGWWVVVDAGQLADRLHEPGARGERSRAEMGIRTLAQDSPVFDALGLLELARAEYFGPCRDPRRSSSTRRHAVVQSWCRSSGCPCQPGGAVGASVGRARRSGLLRVA